MLNILLFITLASLYFSFSLLSVIVMVIARAILFPNRSLQRKFTMGIKMLWLDLTVVFLGVYFTKPIHICYDKAVLSRVRTIVLSNHLTNYDWLYVLVVLHALGKYEDLFIILKESLSRVPIYGYGMRIFGYVFLKRDWSRDKETISNALTEIKKRDKFHLLLFPEGTLFDPITHLKSREFAARM